MAPVQSLFQAFTSLICVAGKMNPAHGGMSGIPGCSTYLALTKVPDWGAFPVNLPDIQEGGRADVSS